MLTQIFVRHSVGECGLKNYILNILHKNRDDIDADDEKKISTKLGLTPISQVKERQQVKISGVLQAITYYPALSSTGLRMGATLFDGTASIDVIWLGRKHIEGITVGKHLIIDGMVVKQNGRLAIMNPIYEILHDKTINDLVIKNI